MVKIWENAILNPLWSKTIFKKDLYLIGRFDAKRIFQRKNGNNFGKRCWQPKM